MNIKEIIKHFRTQAQSRFNPSPDGSREKYYEGREDAYNDCADILERYAVKYPNGWNPASEHPPVDKETGFSELVVGIMPGATVGFPRYVRYQKNKFYDRWIDGYTGVPSAIDIKWWCYPPKED